MARIVLLFVLPFFFATSAIGDEHLDAKVKENCKLEWQTDYQMIKYCIDQQYEAWGKVSARLSKYPEGSEERNIVSRCAAEWPGTTGGFDFTMVEYCSENQTKAYRELK